MSAVSGLDAMHALNANNAGNGTGLIAIAIHSLLAALLLSVRVGVVLFMTPLLGAVRLPGQVRVLALFSLCLWLALMLQPPLADGPAALNSLPSFMLALLCEAVWGLLLGFGLSCAFAAFLLGGRVLELQMGLGVAALYDPASHGQVPIVGYLLQLTAIAGFFAMEGHHALLRALAASLRALPLGASPLQVDLSAVLVQFGLVFSVGLVLVSAAAAGVFLVDVGMSVLARVLPQANTFLLAIPVKLLVGFILLATSVPLLAPVMVRLHEAVWRYWNALLPG